MRVGVGLTGFGVERGVRNPTITIVATLAKALGVPPSDLLAALSIP